MIEYGYLDGPSIERPDLLESYENIMNSLCNLGIKTNKGFLLNPTQHPTPHYIISVEELPTTLITIPTRASDISDHMSEKI